MLLPWLEFGAFTPLIFGIILHHDDQKMPLTWKTANKRERTAFHQAYRTQTLSATVR
jgi:hypothetical protein